ncbi:hypothetical protein HDU76_009470 [Blyttiomyces sp. JEL0837]|nr:hypothetical protein HDU76_009470 [Blyttiomyces sp. JEL0837]
MTTQTLLRRAIAPTAVITVAAASIFPTRIHADDQKPSSTVFQPNRTRLSIYGNPEERYVVVDEPSQLELALRKSRVAVTSYFSETRISRKGINRLLAQQAQVQSVVDQWISCEKKVVEVTKSYAAPGEKLLPNSLYVILSGFAGSIIAKNRGILFRATFPTATALSAFIYLYPGTSRNIFTRSWADAHKSGLVPETVPGLAVGTNVMNEAGKLWKSVQGLFGAKNDETADKEKK